MPSILANPTTLLQIRQNFVELSGRHDLVVDTTNYANNGADYFIQSANRWLDGRQQNNQEVKSYRKDIAAAANRVDVDYLRAALEVWVTDSTGSRTQLSKRDNNYMRTNYKPVISQNTAGTPVDWAPIYNQLSYAQKALTVAPNADFTYDGEDVLFGLQDHQRSIMVMPQADKAYTITILGTFFGRLEADTDTTYWSRVYPDILIQAAMLMVEMHYRNRQGVADMLSALADPLKRIDNALVDEESNEITQIIG